jgi:pullulanase
MNMKKSFTPDEAPVYHGPLGCELRAAPAAADAGSKLSVYRAIFRLWAPGADGVALELADAADLADDYLNPPSLRTGAELSCDPRSGCWSAELELKSEPLNTVYRYRIHRDGRSYILADPYARAFAPFPGAAVEAALGELHAWSVPVPPDADLEPAGGWEGLQRPTGNGAAGSGAPGNIVIYEAMVRDMSVHPDSGVTPALRGTYLGMAEKLDYIASLGVTHIQLLPVMKAYSADETQRDFEVGTGGGNNYNWGYDPLSYFVPEGWFSTDPFDPLSRIRELKTLIREAHARGLGIILDVVYNHMARTHTLEASCPGYWFRRDDAGEFTSNSGCGNDFASQRPMARRLIHDSLRYFLEEFNVDGFRFDLMGLIDDKTILEADAMLRDIRPDVVMLGEGWRMYNGPSGTAGMDQDRAADDIRVAMFSDELRDLMKGGGLNEATAGFISGLEVDKNRLLQNLLGNPQHYFRAFSPRVVVNYLVCHDGLTLRDSIAHNAGIDADREEGRRELIARIKAANLLLGTSQGVVFIHAGQERGRSKPNLTDSPHETVGRFVHNSYNSSDAINAIDWRLENGYGEILDHLRSVLTFRRTEPLLHLGDHGEIQSRTRILETGSQKSLAYALEDGDRGILIIVNLDREDLVLNIDRELPCRCPFRWHIGNGTIEDCGIRIPAHASGLLEYRCG